MRKKTALRQNAVHEIILRSNMYLRMYARKEGSRFSNSMSRRLYIIRCTYLHTTLHIHKLLTYCMPNNLPTIANNDKSRIS